MPEELLAAVRTGFWRGKKDTIQQRHILHPTWAKGWVSLTCPRQGDTHSTQGHIWEMGLVWRGSVQVCKMWRCCDPWVTTEQRAHSKICVDSCAHSLTEGQVGLCRAEAISLSARTVTATSHGIRPLGVSRTSDDGFIPERHEQD